MPAPSPAVGFVSMGNPTVLLQPVQVPAGVPFQKIIVSQSLISPGSVGISVCCCGVMCLSCCGIQVWNSSPKTGGGVSHVLSPVCKPCRAVCVVFSSPCSSCGGTVLWHSFISALSFVLFPALLTPAHAFLHPLGSIPSSPGCLARWAPRFL